MGAGGGGVGKEMKRRKFGKMLQHLNEPEDIMISEIN
jgi:hypothetical protein